VAYGKALDLLSKLEEVQAERYSDNELQLKVS
jgi:hypothetical protein